MRNAFPDRRAHSPSALAIAAVTVLVVFSLWTQREQLDRTAAALAKHRRHRQSAQGHGDPQVGRYAGGVYINEGKLPNLEPLDEQERLAVTRATGEDSTLVAITPIHILLAIQEISRRTMAPRSG